MELEVKLMDANERVEKRFNTLSKLCKRLNVNNDDLIEAYDGFIGTDFKLEYLRHKDAREIVSKVAKNIDEFELEQVADNLVKLYELERIANNWKIKLDKEKNKENMEKIPAIWNFLCDWEIKSIEWYKRNAIRYFDLKEKEESELYNYKATEDYQKRYDELVIANKMYFTYLSLSSIQYKVMNELERKWKKDYYSSIDDFTKALVISYRNRTIDEDKLIKTIAQEKLNKYFDLVNRITKVVGEIKDASNLSIGEQKGEINGYVDGTKGRVRVETISAGGYNIQRFHYRVLLHKVNA